MKSILKQALKQKACPLLMSLIKSVLASRIPSHQGGVLEKRSEDIVKADSQVECRKKVLTTLSFVPGLFKNLESLDRKKFEEPFLAVNQGEKATQQKLIDLHSTIKRNMKANLLPMYYTERVILCNQDFNQTQIDFKRSLYQNVECESLPIC